MAPSTPFRSRARPSSGVGATWHPVPFPGGVLRRGRTGRGPCPADEGPERRQRSGDLRDSTDDDEEHGT